MELRPVPDEPRSDVRDEVLIRPNFVKFGIDPPVAEATRKTNVREQAVVLWMEQVKENK